MSVEDINLDFEVIFQGAMLSVLNVSELYKNDRSAAEKMLASAINQLTSVSDAFINGMSLRNNIQFPDIIFSII